MTHCIYYVRSGPNEELRYSLRTLAMNGPRDAKVSIIGDPPAWVNRAVVQVFPGNPTSNPHKNSFHNLRVACAVEPGDFWTWNDDFMVLDSWPDPFPVWYWKPIAQHMKESMRDPRSNPRKELFRRTLEYIQSRGIENPNHYELHIPMKINGEEMLRILDEASESINIDHPPIWRTLYGNLSTLPSEPHVQRMDVKHHGSFSVPEHLDFLSTDEKSFHRVSYLVDSVFTTKSPWEK